MPFHVLSSDVSIYESQGNYTEALRFYKNALAIYEKSLGPEHPDTANSLNNLAALYYKQGKLGEAMPLYQRALAIYEKSLGPEHPSTKLTKEEMDRC
jgi:tetratricopeptide (TPR) repeat protein